MTLQDVLKKATPGPLTVDLKHLAIYGAPEGRLCGCNAIVVADTKNLSVANCPTDEQAMANAILLAHAYNQFPELVAALEALLACPAMNEDFEEIETTNARVLAEGVLYAAKKIGG